ncbi:MAG: Bug family tripartite tricarboxylate transporter substrate binding protein [Burkholderiales bacterium]
MFAFAVRKSRLAAVAALLSAFAMPVGAQTYPTKPIRLIVPFSPGGSADLIARLVGQQISEAAGQQVLVDNRAGAGGNIGVEMVAKAAPDGYTLLIGHIGTFGVNPTLYPKLPFDPIRDFQPVSLYTKLPNMLAVHPSLPVRTTKELIALAKKTPGQLNYGSAGNGSAAHLATEYFKLLTKIQIEHIPYKGTGPAVIDLIAGQVSLMITGVPPLLAHVKAGKLRALGVASAQRIALLPDLPTLIEAGVPGYETSQWHGVLAPAGTPRPIVDALNAMLVKSLQRPAVKERLASEAAEGVGSTPEQFQEFIKSEIARWAPVVKASGLRAE